MKKTLIISGAILVLMNQAFGITLCAKNNTYVGILKKDVAGLSGESTNDGKKWKIDFGYKIITGIAACNEVSGTYATPLTNLYTSSGDAGDKCWCKMEPVLSYGYETGITSHWMFLSTYSDASSCASSCTAACMNAVKSDTVFRSAMYESVW